MAITRKLNEISLTFDATGNPAVVVTGIVTDTDEGTAAGARRDMAQAAVVAAAVQLRDAVLTVAANAGKPLTF